MRSLSFLLLLAAFPAAASDFDGSSASLLWGLPFALILLSIALGPLFFSRIWHHHFGKITAFWTLLFLTPFIITFGFGAGIHTVAHALVEEYIPLYPAAFGALYHFRRYFCQRRFARLA